ncbi:MAG: hypothetical protein HY905_03940 [Deltaproteobacteria bacterium]|nr:hypothetical protein [Deltaproteobacteria bacterium]
MTTMNEMLVLRVLAEPVLPVDDGPDAPVAPREGFTMDELAARLPDINREALEAHLEDLVVRKLVEHRDGLLVLTGEGGREARSGDPARTAATGSTQGQDSSGTAATTPSSPRAMILGACADHAGRLQRSPIGLAVPALVDVASGRDFLTFARERAKRDLDLPWRKGEVGRYAGALLKMVASYIEDRRNDPRDLTQAYFEALATFALTVSEHMRRVGLGPRSDHEKVVRVVGELRRWFAAAVRPPRRRRRRNAGGSWWNG